MAYLVSKMRSTTLLAQLVSILRAKLYKVVLRGNNNNEMFSNFRALFLKINILEVVSFFSHLVLIQST